MSERPIRRMLARLFLALTGWKPQGARPDVSQYVLIAAPHTSNWDFPYLLAFAEHFGLQISWVGKHTLFGAPFGPIMRALGGIPVRRHERRNLVQDLAALFESRSELGLVVPAEGTRDRVDYWKSGFYHIAQVADVPIVMSFLDYEAKTGGFGPAFRPSGDLSKDMDAIRAFYEDKRGRFPDQFETPRLSEEDERPDAAVGARIEARRSAPLGEDKIS